MQCPYCAKDIKDEAIKCKHCGVRLLAKKQPRISKQLKLFSQTATQPKQPEPEKTTSPQQEQGIPSFHIEVKGLIMNEKEFSFRKKKYAYNDVIGLYYKHQRQTFNFLHSTHVMLRIKISDNNIIKLKTKFGMFNEKTVSALEEAHTVLHRLTFDNRLNYYLTTMKQNGYIDYKFLSSYFCKPSSVRIYADGFVEKRSKRINLRVAKQSGTLIFGTYAETFTGRQSHYNSCEIAIAEKPNARLMFALTINAEWDTGIIHGIIKLLSEGKRL